MRLGLTLSALVLTGCGRFGFAAESGISDDAGGDDASVPACVASSPARQTDPRNCGACGHDCLAGACSAGVCQAATLAAGQAGISSLALDDTTVYWADRVGGAVKSCARTGCAQPTTLADAQVEPFTVTVDDTNVYWTNYAIGNLLTNVVACAKTGCANAPTELASGFFGPLGIAVDDTNVYFATYNDGTIDSCPLTGCGASPTVLASNEGSAWALAIDDTNVYWTINMGTGFIRRCAKTGCANAPFTLAGSQVNAQSLAIENGRAVWANDGDGFLNTCDLPDCAGGLGNVSHGPNAPHSINLLDGVAYWIDRDAIKSCPIAGCADMPTTVYPAGGEQVVVDERGIYWTDGVTVWGLAR